MAIRLLSIMFLGSFFVLSGCAESDNSSEASESDESVEDQLANNLVEGAYAYVTYELSGMGTTEENLHNFVRNTSSRENIERMVLEGDLLPIEKGTSVQILEVHFTWVKVEIMSGSYTGTVAYALREYIGAKPE